MHSIKNYESLQTIHFKASGIITEENVREMSREGEKILESYGGKKKILVYADLRGMKTHSPQVAGLLGEMIGYQRAHGVTYCVHLSDQTIARLQMLRIVRQAQPEDAGTIDVESPEEAERVLAELRLKIRAEEKG